MNDTATAHEKALLLKKLEEAPMYWCSSFGCNSHALNCRYQIFNTVNPPKGFQFHPGLLFYIPNRPDALIHVLTHEGPPFYRTLRSVNFDGTARVPVGTLTFVWELIDE